VIVGEFISDEIGELFNREQRIVDQYKKYCWEHGKVLDNRYSLRPDSLFALEIIIKDDDDRQVKSC
jgi:hypothetical protein